MGLSIGPVSSAGGGDVTEDVQIPAIALFEHPEDATTLFEAVDSGAAGLTVTLREPLEYGQDTSQWTIVGAQRYQGEAAVDLSITGPDFSDAAYLGEFTTVNAPARDTLTTPHLFYDTTLGLFQVGDQNTDWGNVSIAAWQGIYGVNPTYRPWNPRGGWGNLLETANGLEYADQDAIEASIQADYARYTSSIYNSSPNVLWFDQSTGTVKTFGTVTPAVDGVEPDPVHVVVDAPNMLITAYYNIAARGALTGPDTLGDLKGAFDTAAEGLSSEYVGGGDMDTDVTRPFANVSRFSQADLRGLRLMLTAPIAGGASGNAFTLLARARFPGGAEVTERQAHILIYTNTGRTGGIRVTLDSGINGLNEHGVPVDISSGALGNEWHFVTRTGTENTESVTVSTANRQIIFTANRLGLDETFASQVLDACNRGGTGCSATTFGGYGSSRHVFRGSLGDLNASINRFHDGRDYHAATANPEPIAVTEGPRHAHTRLYTVADGGIVLSLIDPAHDEGNGFYFETVAGSPLGVEVAPTEERITLTIPTAGATAADILAAFNADEALSAVYFGTETGTNNVLPTRFGRHEMLGGLDSTEIEIQYAPEATGGITDVDTMGDVKTAWDAGDGRISFYYNGADQNTEASRLVPWEHEFEDGETDTFSLAGFSLGPEQNEFTGADRAAAETARDTYAAANPTWVEAYRGLPDVWIALRWGTDQVGQVLRDTATNPPGAGDWIDQDLALRGSKGAQGNDGHSPVFSSGDAFPTTPAPAANDFHVFPRDVASGLLWLDGSMRLTSAAAGDVARFDGTNWRREANLISNDGVLNAATFDDTSYMASLARTVGPSVALDLSPILTALDAVRTRLTALEGGDTTGTIYFGWSADRTIDTSDFASFNSVTGVLEGTLPNTATAAYIVVAVPETDGVPTGIFVAGGANSIDAYTRQPGTVDDPDGVATIVMVSNDTQSRFFSGSEIIVELV